MLTQEKINDALEIVHSNPGSAQCKMLEVALMKRLLDERNAYATALDLAITELKDLADKVGVEVKAEGYRAAIAESDDSEIDQFMRIISEEMKPKRSRRGSSKPAKTTER